MKTLTLRGFYRFIRRQPPGRRMVHSKGWCACAVGDYIRDADVNLDVTTHAASWDFAENALPKYLHHTLNTFGRAHRHVPTYGKLSEFISKRGRV